MGFRQGRSILGQHSRDGIVYLLACGQETYIGLTFRRLVHQLSEHSRELRALEYGRTPKYRRRRRYEVLLSGCITSTLGLFALGHYARDSAESHEAARIFIAQPSANGPAIEHLAQRFRYHYGTRHRAPSTRRGKLACKHMDAADSEWMSHVDARSVALHEARIRRAILHFSTNKAKTEQLRHWQLELMKPKRCFDFDLQARLGVVGPLTIYGPGMFGLLFKAACQQKVDIDWNVALSAYGANTSSLYEWWEATACVCAYRDRVRIQSRISSFLRCSCLPSPGAHYLLVPHESFRLSAQGWARRNIMTSFRNMPVMQNHLLRDLKILVKPSPQWRFKLVDIQAQLRQYQVPRSFPEDEDLNKHMLRIPANPKIRANATFDDLLQEMQFNCAQWCKPLGFGKLGRRVSRFSFSTCLDVSLPCVNHDYQDLQDVFDHDKKIEKFVGPQESCCTLLEDKDPSVVWRVPFATVMKRWIGQSNQHKTRWQ